MDRDTPTGKNRSRHRRCGAPTSIQTRQCGGRVPHQRARFAARSLRPASWRTFTGRGPAGSRRPERRHRRCPESGLGGPGADVVDVAPDTATVTR